MTVRRRQLVIVAVILCFILPPSSVILCFAGTVRTLDGRTLDGEVKLEQAGQIAVTRPGVAKPERIPLADVLSATFRNEPARPAAAAAAAARTENGQLPAPWQATDVGKLAAKGYARYTSDGETFSIKSAGATVGGVQDAFCFVAQPVGGDADLVARFVTVTNAEKVAQGLMIRAGRDPDAAYAAIFCVGRDLRFMTRPRAGEATDGGTVGLRVTLPAWLRLARRGNTVTAYVSTDGNAWEQIGSEVVPAPAGATTLAGIAVCGRNEQLNGGHVTGVRLTSVTPAAAAPVAPASLKEGIMLRSGTVLAGAQIERADDGSVRFTKGDRRETVSLVNVARIVFRELPPDMVAKIPAKGAGVLLKEGDFVEGEFKGLREGKVQLSSVLFGLAKFEPRDKAVAVVLNDLEPGRPQLVIRTVDGSVYVARAVAPDKDLLVIDDAIGGQFSVNRWDVAEIAAGAGRLEPLSALKPQKIEPAAAAAAAGGDGLSVDATGLGLPLTLGGVTFDRGLTLTAGGAVAYDLDGKYRTLTFKCGVPQGVLATAAVRFVVLADGKEVYRSRPRTSRDDPLTTSIPLQGVKFLTLKVDPAANEPLPTPGLFGDAALVK